MGEYRVFRELSQGEGDVLGRASGPPRCGMVGAMLEGDPAERKREGARRVEIIR